MKRKIEKAKLNYWIDVGIAVGFILSAISGIVLALAPSSGFQGGRNPDYIRKIIGLSRFVWKDVHTWSSIFMSAGVLGHLLLHLKWIRCMTKNIGVKI
jgi:hypothetical protein